VSHRGPFAAAFSGVDEDFHGELPLGFVVDFPRGLQDVLRRIPVRSKARHWVVEFAIPATLCGHEPLSLRPGAAAFELKVDGR
jgi:hypothetical protein